MDPEKDAKFSYMFRANHILKERSFEYTKVTEHLHNSSLDVLYSNLGLSECLITCSLALNQSS